MEDYLVRGFHYQDKSKKFELKLPSARKYKILTVNDTNETLQPAMLIREAVRMRQKTFLKRGHGQPVIYKGYQCTAHYCRSFPNIPFLFNRVPLYLIWIVMPSAIKQKMKCSLQKPCSVTVNHKNVASGLQFRVDLMDGEALPQILHN